MAVGFLEVVWGVSGGRLGVGGSGGCLTGVWKVSWGSLEVV